MEITRRKTLELCGGAIVASSVAGCTGVGDVEPTGGSGVYASFFTLAEFTRNVAGDALTVENAVPAGEHGHGWEPPTSLLPEITETDAFVYLDVEGFQPWAEDAAAELAENYDEVRLIDALSGMELLEYDGHHGHDHEIGTVSALDIIDRSTGDVVADAHADHWHGELPAVPLGDHLSLGATFFDRDGDEISVGHTQSFQFDARVDGDETAVLDIESHGDHVHLRGESTGTVTVVFLLVDGDHVEWSSPPISASVVGRDGGDSEYAHDDYHGDDSHDHTHGEYDVKFFSDPVLAQEGVKNIRDGLIELDPDNAERYADNAAAYIDRLDELHRRYAAALADREHEVVVLAGHDSFQYLGARYDFEIHTPVGLSPHDTPSSGEIAETLELVESEGIEYVLWDYFDGPRIADVIVEESDTVQDALMVSPAESLIDEWSQEGYGDYIGQMVEINLPAFERALGAK